MTKIVKKTVITTAAPEKETLLDKTTRIVRQITDDEADVRHVKTARLRKARFENKDQEPIKVATKKP